MEEYVEAIFNGDEEGVRAGIQRFGTAQKFRSLTPLSHAIETEEPAMVEILLKAGADPNRGGSIPYEFAFDIAPWQRRFFGGPALDGRARARQARARDSALGRHALGLPLWMAVHTDAELTKLLLEYGADPNAYPSVNDLVWSIEEPEILALLLQYGAHPEASPNGQSNLFGPFETQRSEMAIEMAEILLKAGVGPNPVDVDTGQTILEEALWEEDYEFAELFLKYGADPYTRSEGRLLVDHPDLSPRAKNLLLKYAFKGKRSRRRY